MYTCSVYVHVCAYICMHLYVCICLCIQTYAQIYCKHFSIRISSQSSTSPFVPLRLSSRTFWRNKAFEVAELWPGHEETKLALLTALTRTPTATPLSCSQRTGPCPRPFTSTTSFNHPCLRKEKTDLERAVTSISRGREWGCSVPSHLKTHIRLATDQHVNMNCVDGNNVASCSTATG